MSRSPRIPDYDLQKVVTPNRLLGLWRMMTGFRLKYLGATLSLGVSALSKTLTYMLLRYFVDHYLVAQTGSVPLIFIALGFLGLATIEGSMTFTSGRLAAQTAEGITRRLRNYLFDHIQQLSFSYHDQAQTGDLIERCTSDVDAMRRFFSDQAIGIGRIILLFTINFVALININPTLAVVSIVVLPLIVVASFFFFKRISKAYAAYQEQEATLSTTLQENLTGVRVVKAFARQEYERKKFEKDNWEKFVRGRRLTRMHSLFWPISDIVCGFQLLGGFLAAALMAINGEITVGTYMAYSGLVGWLIWPMRNLGRLIVQTSTGLVSFGRVREIIKQPREALTVGRYQPEKPVQGEIVFDQVGFSYEDDNELILQDISFTCQPGQVVALLGSTGSGKTSLINLLPRFYDYTSGSIKLDGVELKDYAPEFLRSQIGTVEQEPFLFSRTIGENIAYGVGRDVPHTEIEQAAQMAAVHDVILTFPQGYETMVGEKGVTLSGGQKQRVTIARTLLKDPRILILDDSTSSVDTETEAFIRDALRCLNVGRTTFIIAHRIQSVMNADLIVVLDKGRIVQKGTHAELLAQEGMYRQIYDLQTRIDEEVEKEVAGAAAR